MKDYPTLLKKILSKWLEAFEFEPIYNKQALEDHRNQVTMDQDKYMLRLDNEREMRHLAEKAYNLISDKDGPFLCYDVFNYNGLLFRIDLNETDDPYITLTKIVDL